MRHNMANAGAEWDELVWVDNGSQNPAIPDCEPDIIVGFKENLGVARGYNAAMALASGTHMVITGCDRLMPDNWLRAMKDQCTEGSPAVCIWEKSWDKYPERIRGGVTVHGGVKSPYENLWALEALPIGARMFTREFLSKVGYLREDFGLYGWEDVEWAHRAMRVADSLDLHPLVLTQLVAEHLGTEGCAQYDGRDPADYHAFKKAQAEDPAKRALFEKCKAEGFPYYNPYV